MTSKDNLVARARTAVVRRLDPVAAKRTATLAERRTNGIEATPEVAAALDATAALAVRDLAQRIRSGDLDAHHQAALAQLVEAYLSEHPAESLPHGVAQAVASSFEGLWQPVGEPVNEPPPFIRDVIRDQFHRLYYHVSKRTWKDTWYRGVRTYKCPTDMWIYMELDRPARARAWSSRPAPTAAAARSTSPTAWRRSGPATSSPSTSTSRRTRPSTRG